MSEKAEGQWGELCGLFQVIDVLQTKMIEMPSLGRHMGVNSRQTRKYLS